MATQIDLGAVVPIGKGDWNPSTTYERANIVRHNSVAWICKVATSLGVEPTETSSDWYLLVKDTSSVTSVNGMRGDVTIDSVLENPSIDDNSLKIASTAWANTKISQVDSKAEEALSKTGLPLGHIYLWPFSTPPDGSIQLNGGTYSRELYSDLWNLIQTKGWYKPEAEWQSIASANNGYCPWYSDGDGSTTFRVPKFAPYQKLALASSDAGKYYEAGLPNITSSNSPYVYQYTPNGISHTPLNSGCLTWKNDGGGVSTGKYPETGSGKFYIDASKSSPIYGKSPTVQPESNDWIVCVVAFGKATNVGSVDVANVMSAVNQVQSDVNEIQSDVNQVQANPNLQGISHLIETWKSDDGMSWYRKWSDRWIEQGGRIVIDPMGSHTDGGAYSTTRLTFPVSFTKLIRWQCQARHDCYTAGFEVNTNGFSNVTSVKVYQKNTQNSVYINTFVLWYACGYY